MTDTTNTDQRRRPQTRTMEVNMTGGGSGGGATPDTVTPRQAETQQKRRRREGLGPERNLKMHIPESQKDPNFTYRWANDRPGRLHQLTVEDDWDVAPDQLGGGLGTVSERAVDKYTGEKAVLLRKLKTHYEADKASQETERKKGDATMRRGPLPTPEGAVAAESYVPGGKNIINGQ